MGTNYNITPKQFNGTDYDTLYFKNTSQQVLLNDSDLATILGLSGTPNVDEALNEILTSTVEVSGYDGGNNEHTSTTPMSVEIPFQPKFVIISNFSSDNWGLGLFPYNCIGADIAKSDPTVYTTSWNTVSDGTTTLTWYYPNQSAASVNLDVGSVHYYVYAFR